MKRGIFFAIPESPTDLAQIRRRATTLDERTRPTWLDTNDDGYYRYIGQYSCAGLPSRERAVFSSELEALEAAGVIGEWDPSDANIIRLYISAAGEYDEWSIGIYHGNSPLAWRPGSTNPVLTRDDVTDVAAELVADPFMIEVDGTWFMFFEVLNWKTRKGEIGLATSPDALQWQYQQVVLDEPFHLSYPYVFRNNGELYMIPETHQARAVRLYHATDFPTRWTLVTTLLEGRYIVDASLLHANETWWLFTETSPQMKHDTLRLFGSKDLFGPWSEHPKSPIVLDNPKSARPAGRVVRDGNRIFRFAQDCSGDYGTEVRAFEITKLSASSYEENEIGDAPLLGPTGSGWNACGMHHIDAHKRNGNNWVACVDGWNRNEE